MLINNSSYPNYVQSHINNVAQTKKVEKSQVTTPVKPFSAYFKDAYESSISNQGAEMPTIDTSYFVAQAALKNVPDIREDKVNDIKSRIQNGTYYVSPEDFANKLVSNL